MFSILQTSQTFKSWLWHGQDYFDFIYHSDQIGVEEIKENSRDSYIKAWDSFNKYFNRLEILIWAGNFRMDNL